jgi:dihydrodipicolinate synthase/N-acetylneuraminate lyase
MRLPVGTSPDGPIAAAVTPRNQREEIDFGAGYELIDFLSCSGVSGIALFTAIGEYAALSPDERSRFLCLAIRRSRVPVYVGIGAATLDSALALARDARDAGACGLLLPPPYGFAYEQDDIREFYHQFAAHTTVNTPAHADAGPPVYLIDSPGLCTPIDPATAKAIVAGGGFAGFADAVSAPAGAIPEVVVAKYKASREGRDEAVTIAQGMLEEFDAWTRQFPAPVALKTAVALRGVKTGHLPVPLTAKKQQRLEEFRAWFSNWLPAAKKQCANA